MKAIITRYLPCTNTKGSRIVATDGHNRIVIGYASASSNPHADAALALCRKLNWTGTLVEGGLGDGRCVFVFDEHSERHAIEPGKPGRYTLKSGRCIVRDGLPVATISGVNRPNGGYTIGLPAYLDDFAREIVGALNRS